MMSTSFDVPTELQPSLASTWYQRNNLPATPIYRAPVDIRDCDCEEISFSHAACPGCGCRLSGAWHLATVFVKAGWEATS